MGATVTFKEANGVTPDWTTKTSTRCCAADAHNPGLNYPIPIPTSGYKYSYWKTICMELAGSFTKVSNIKVFSDGAVGFLYGSGGAFNVGIRDSGDSGLPIESYQQADGEEGVSGYAIDDVDNGHAYYKTAPNGVANIEDYTSVSPLDFDSTEYTEAGKTKALVFQVKLDTLANGAESGLQNAEPVSLKYDEI
jgi:hypothetical protein